MNIIVIVPVYNESGIIEHVVRDLMLRGYKIIVVDDGSNDDSFKKICQFPVSIIHHSFNLGQGAALQTGMEMAKRMDADIVVHFDGDGQHSSVDIERIIKPLLTDESDIVFGSRFLNKQGLNAIPYLRKILLQLARFVDWLFTGVLLSDAHNGLRALNRKSLEKITILENGMAHATEIIIQSRKHHLRHMEVPVTIHYTPYSQRKGQSPWNALHILMSLIFKKLLK
jgi:polyprenyl-phospho-N-acetylgalactosaminyl synthase